MSIRITRNAEGNCINFVGSSNPAYWNACLSSVINAEDSDRIDIINDIRSLNSAETAYEFYAVRYETFADKDGNSFADAQAAVDYINSNANVSGVSSDGADLSNTAVNFRLDATSTSVIMDNGSAFGVNTIKAVADADGTIHIHAIGAGTPDGADAANDLKHFEKLIHTNVSVNGAAVSGGLQDVVNTLNELFTVGPFEAVVIADPYSTMIADVAGTDAGYTLEGADAVDPIGDDIFTYDGSGYANYAGLKSATTIDQAGEYYTFDIRGEGVIGFGLVHSQASFDAGNASGNQNYANPANFAAINSAHYGMQFSHWFHPTPNGSWTNYGASTGYVMGPGWSNWDQKQDWLDGNPVKVRVGLDENGYIAISSLQDDGTWVLHARSSYPVASGSEFHLGIKSQSTAARVRTAPKVHLLAPAAPTMYFRYIESPDGNYDYPVFATAEEADYYDLQNGGSGTSSTATYADDPTGTTWYIPTNGFSDDQSGAPSGGTFEGNAINWTEVTSLTDADLAPSAFSSLDYSYEEGTAVNFQLYPAGATFSQTVTVSPSGSGMVYNAATGYLQGTLTDVGADTTYTVTVTRANAYGSSVGTFEVVATDVAPVQTMVTPWTKALDFSGSSEHLKQVSQSTSSNALRMVGFGQVVAANSDPTKTSSDLYSRPWATTVVFKSDGNNSNQHIWNSGEGTATGSDNIYLRLSSGGQLYFGWGREGTGYNEKQLASVTGGQWYGVYIAHKGTRLSASDASAANLEAAFDIRVAGHNDIYNDVGADQYLVTPVGYWTSTGNRMDHAVVGDFTIAGRGSNRSFHGQVASMVVTTLRKGQDMPSDAEIKLMLTDPKKWEDDYKDGQTARYGFSGNNFTYSPSNGKYATQIWLMGDGTLDSYGNGIRNQVDPTEQNNTKLQLNSMVSNDIENVTILGLS